MNITQAKREIDKTDWYYQGAASKPLYISWPLSACYLMKIFGKKIPVRFKTALYIKNNFMEDYISKDSLKRVALYYAAKQKQDKKFINKLISNWREKYVKPFLKLNKEILKFNLKKLPAGELFRLFKKFSAAYLAVWHEAIFLDGFDYYGEKILADALKVENKNINAKDLEILLTPPFVSFLQKERLALLGLAEMKQVKNLKKELEKISRDFYWLNNNYASVEYLTPEYFQKKLRKLLKDKNKIKEEKAMRLFIKNLGKRKSEIYKKYKLSSDFRKITKLLARLGNLRDERKSYNQQAGNALRKFVEALAKKTGLKISEIEHLYHQEIPDILKNVKNLAKLARLRQRGVFHLSENYKSRNTFYSREAKMLNSYIKTTINSGQDLKGMPAYGGIVSGKVKIVRDKKDFFKMKPGDILVSQNTRPEFVPVIKRAGAIITDEGGITCHAAIVSRELKIPAIVGAQGASLKLKDGDLVEVDADKGIIKILK